MIDAPSSMFELIDDVSALYVRKDGPYPELLSDWWDEDRNAMGYRGPNPVIAHPPCKRWGRFWHTDGSKSPGNDGGLFAAALYALRRFGGVLEHPEGSKAWDRFGLPGPSLGSWVRGLGPRTWATTVAQSTYGHRAKKLTWLLFVGDSPPPPIDWTVAPATAYLSQPGRGSKGKPRKRCVCQRCRDHFGGDWIGRPAFERMSARENELTPRPFAELLISLARGAT